MDALREVDGHGARCRYEDAVYYANGRVALLGGNRESGYRVVDRTTVGELLAAEPDGWTHIYFMHEYAAGGFLAVAGETSWGGAGFIALKQVASAELLWVIHLSDCNNFISVSVKSGFVIAVSDAPYPKGAQYVVPIDAPEKLRVVAL